MESIILLSGSAVGRYFNDARNVSRVENMEVVSEALFSIADIFVFNWFVVNFPDPSAIIFVSSPAMSWADVPKYLSTTLSMATQLVLVFVISIPKVAFPLVILVAIE